MAGVSEGRRPEWPPNPHRLFQALVAAGHLGVRRIEFSECQESGVAVARTARCPGDHRTGGARGECRSPLRPKQRHGQGRPGLARNTEPEKQPNELRTDKDLRPHRLDDDATVRFLWPIADDEWQVTQPHAETLCAEARHLHALGLGIDLVAGNGRILADAEKQALPGEVWIADGDGIGWRMPMESSLDELLSRHAEQAKRVQAGRGRGAGRWVSPPAPPTVYREVAYLRRAEGRRRPVHVFALVAEEGAYCSFDPRRAIEVAAWLRHAAHERAKAMKLDPEFVERFVCGHGEDVEAKNDRFSYLPLPTIPAKGRDGRIRRVLIAEPFGGGGGKAQAVARRLSGAPLIEDGTGEIMADLRAVDDPFAEVTAARYLRKAQVWASATPLVLPGRDDYRKRKANALVLKALAQAGYTTPVAEIALQR